MMLVAPEAGGERPENVSDVAILCADWQAISAHIDGSGQAARTPAVRALLHDDSGEHFITCPWSRVYSRRRKGGRMNTNGRISFCREGSSEQVGAGCRVRLLHGFSGLGEVNALHIPGVFVNGCPWIMRPTAWLGFSPIGFSLVCADVWRAACGLFRRSSGSGPFFFRIGLARAISNWRSR